MTVGEELADPGVSRTNGRDLVQQLVGSALARSPVLAPPDLAQVLGDELLQGRYQGGLHRLTLGYRLISGPGAFAQPRLLGQPIQWPSHLGLGGPGE